MTYGDSEQGHMGWYAIRVKPQCEWKVDAGLAGRGLETFLPARKKPVTVRSRKDVAPLFPGYLFCRFNAARSLVIVSTPGVLHVVSFGSVPVAVDEQEIFNLQTLNSLHLSIAPWPTYEAGQNITITDGPLRNVSGTIVDDKGRTRLLVSVSLLKRTVMCEVDRAWVERLSQPPTIERALYAARGCS